VGEYAYVRHEIHNGSRLESLKPNSDYQAMRTALAAHVAADAELDRFVTEKLGHLLEPTVNEPATVSPPTAQATPANPQQPVQTRASQWQLTDPFVANLAPLGAGAIFNVKRTVKEQRHRYSLLEQAAYDQYRDAAAELMTRHLPSQAFYLGVGRSSSPIVALMENLNQQMVGYLPADGTLAQVSPPAASALQQALDAAVPQAVLASGRPIVLFQQGARGATLAQIQQVLQQHLASRGLTNPVSSVVLTPQSAVAGVGRLDTAGLPFLRQLGDAAIKAVAVRSRTRPGVDPLPAAGAARREKFELFKSALLQRMQRDAVLHNWLQGAVDGA
jgi:hypothetical protein